LAKEEEDLAGGDVKLTEIVEQFSKMQRQQHAAIQSLVDVVAALNTADDGIGVDVAALSKDGRKLEQSNAGNADLLVKAAQLAKDLESE